MGSNSEPSNARHDAKARPINQANPIELDSWEPQVSVRAPTPLIQDKSRPWQPPQKSPCLCSNPRERLFLTKLCSRLERLTQASQWVGMRMAFCVLFNDGCARVLMMCGLEGVFPQIKRTGHSSDFGEGGREQAKSSNRVAKSTWCGVVSEIHGCKTKNPVFLAMKVWSICFSVAEVRHESDPRPVQKNMLREPNGVGASAAA